MENEIKLYLNGVRLAIFFKDFAHWTKSSCVGLAVAGHATATFLHNNKINARAYAVRHNIDLVETIYKHERENNKLTHIIISAPWLSRYDMENLIKHFSYIKFIILSHSNVGFLQADPWGVKLLREYIELSKKYKNLNIGGNSLFYTKWFETVYKHECVCLPNLYPTNKVPSKQWDGHTPIKIGSFGAIRPEKNFMTAAAAALGIHSLLNVPVSLNMSSGGENCPSTTLSAINQMTENIKDFELHRHHWNTWDKFIELVGSMDLLISPSYTESFHMVTADGISRGIPSVVSPTIYWCPDDWKANPDSALDIAEVGIKLLKENQGFKGFGALGVHNEKGLKRWVDYLK